MYTQCDPDGNQYVLLDDKIESLKINPALSIEDQNSVVEGRICLAQLLDGKYASNGKTGRNNGEILEI